VPDCIRRCYFLSLAEKEVLYELYSWANTTSRENGTFKVTDSHIRGSTGLSLSGVKKALASLADKGFILKRIDYDGRNIYRVGEGANPYLLLSEMLHAHKRHTLQYSWPADKFADFNEQVQWGKSKKCFVEAILELAHTPELYQPYDYRWKSVLAHSDARLARSEIEALYSNVQKEIEDLIASMFFK
jgi:hypothetical protein